jgi:hypothetical protein
VLARAAEGVVWINRAIDDLFRMIEPEEQVTALTSTGPGDEGAGVTGRWA